MPRKLLIECSCDRCGRIWYEEPPGEDQEFIPCLDMKWLGTPVLFESLCKGCTKSLSNLVEKMKKLGQSSPVRSGAKKERPKKDRPSRKGSTPRSPVSSPAS